MITREELLQELNEFVKVNYALDKDYQMTPFQNEQIVDFLFHQYDMASEERSASDFLNEMFHKNWTVRAGYLGEENPEEAMFDRIHKSALSDPKLSASDIKNMPWPREMGNCFHFHAEDGQQKDPGWMYFSGVNEKLTPYRPVNPNAKNIYIFRYGDDLAEDEYSDDHYSAVLACSEADATARFLEKLQQHNETASYYLYADEVQEDGNYCIELLEDCDIMDNPMSDDKALEMIEKAAKEAEEDMDL